MYNIDGKYSVGDVVGIDIYGKQLSVRGDNSKFKTGKIVDMENTNNGLCIKLLTNGVERYYDLSSIYKKSYIKQLVSSNEDKYSRFNSQKFIIKKRIVDVARELGIKSDLLNCGIFDMVDNNVYYKGSEIIEEVYKYHKVNPYDTDINGFISNCIENEDFKIKDTENYNIFSSNRYGIIAYSEKNKESDSHHRFNSAYNKKLASVFINNMNRYINLLAMNNEECNIDLYKMIDNYKYYSGKDIKEAVKQYLSYSNGDKFVSRFASEYIYCNGRTDTYELSDKHMYRLDIIKDNLVAIRKRDKYNDIANSETDIKLNNEVEEA